MHIPTEVKIKEIMEPLKAAEFESRYRICEWCDGTGKREYGVQTAAQQEPADYDTEILECEDCDGKGYVPQHEPDDGGEAGMEVEA